MSQNESESTPGDAVQIVVWDGLIRLFHWTLVFGILSAYLSAKYRLEQLHILIGYILAWLLLLRIVWGFCGSRYARYSSFLFAPKETLQYLRSMLSGTPRHYLGHNPAGAIMVFALLILLTLLYLTGFLTLASIDFGGPMTSLINPVNDQTSYFFRHLHGWLVNAGMGLVVIHLLGVISGSFQHRENLVRAMITGKKNSD